MCTYGLNGLWKGDEQWAPRLRFFGGWPSFTFTADYVNDLTSSWEGYRLLEAARLQPSFLSQWQYSCCCYIRLQSVQNCRRTRQPTWSPGLVVTTTSRRFLLAYTGFQCASESSTRRRCLCESCTMQPLATWLTCVCRPTLCVVASNCVPRRLGLCWSRAPWLLPVSAASPSIDHEHGTVCQPILEHQILLQASSQGPPVSAV